MQRKIDPGLWMLIIAASVLIPFILFLLPFYFNIITPTIQITNAIVLMWLFIATAPFGVLVYSLLKKTDPALWILIIIASVLIPFILFLLPFYFNIITPTIQITYTMVIIWMLTVSAFFGVLAYLLLGSRNKKY